MNNPDARIITIATGLMVATLALGSLATTTRAGQDEINAEKARQRAATAALQKKLQQSHQQELRRLQQERQRALQAKIDSIHARAEEGMAYGELSTKMAGNAYSAANAEAREENMYGRLDSVMAALLDRRPPNRYASVQAGQVRLTNPFAAVASGDPLADSVAGTCLEENADLGLVRIGLGCPSDGCFALLEPGMYPVSPGGSPLDTPETVRSFLEACARFDAPMQAFAPDGELLVLQPARAP